MMTAAVALMALFAMAASSAEAETAEGRRLQEECDAGRAPACTRLGWILFEGDAPPMGRVLAAFRRGCDLRDGWGCLAAGSTLLQRQDSDPGYLLQLYRRGCEFETAQACRGIVSDVARTGSKPRFASTEDARYALSQLRRLCDAASGRACGALGLFARSGVAGIQAADLGEALRLTEQACRIGWKPSCDIAVSMRRATDLQRAEPPSTEGARDGLREEVVRTLLPTTNVKGDSTADERRPLCVAFGSEEDPDGADAPAPFLERFADVPSVRPASWCREHQEGNVIVIGPVTDGPGPPYAEARIWRILYAWDGTVSPMTMKLARKDGRWTLGQSQGMPPFPVPASDHDEDRKRIQALVTSFVDAWNRGEPLREAGSISPRDYGARHAEAVVDVDKREHTRLEIPAPLEVEFELPRFEPTLARVRLRLRGTFVHRPGLAWPLQPWKQAGAVAPMELALRRTGGWWRAGEWTIELENWLTQAPWSPERVVS